MDWIKKNWITIAIVVLAVAVIIYFLKRKKKTGPAITGAKAGAGPSVKEQLASCEKTAQGIRLIPGAPHPCAGLRDAAAKESAYFAQQVESAYGGNIDDKINVVDYAIGNQGMGMLEENNFGLPSFDLRPAAESSYNALSTGGGLNVVDYAAGLEGTSLLLGQEGQGNRTIRMTNIRANG